MMFTKPVRRKRDFYNEITQITKDGIKTIQELSSQMDQLDADIKSGKYSYDHLEKDLRPQLRDLKKQIEDVRMETNKKAQKLCDDYQDELRAEDDLDPMLLTDDVKLLHAGVKLKPRDISAMLKRNADNHTMTQVILRYCKENDIDTGGVNYVGNSYTIRDVDVMRTNVDVSLKWSNRPTVYEKLMGEGSDSDRVFTD